MVIAEYPLLKKLNYATIASVERKDAELSVLAKQFDVLAARALKRRPS